MNKKLYWPLYLIEAYLVFSILLLYFGPLQFDLHNDVQFVILIIAYHASFIIGYSIGATEKTTCRTDIYSGSDLSIRNRYSFLIVIVLYIWIVVTRNNTHAGSYIPIDFFQKVITGLLNPASRYYVNKGADALNLFSGNKVITGSVLLIYFLYYCFPALTIWYWKKISTAQKIWSVIVILLCILQGFAAGVNAIIFHVIFSLSGGLAIMLATRNADGIERSKRKEKRTSKRVKRAVIVMLSLGVLYFVYNIDSRLGGNTLAYYTSKSPDISISPAYVGLINSPVLSPLVKGLASIQSYICQGYYGMSIAIDQGFTSTFGLGHSFFLATSLDSMLGTHIIARTYQEKITHLWSRTVNWHSFYSQMANDVGFYGVIIVMFVLGIITAKVWKDIINNNNPIAKMFMVVLIPVFAFMPMNNQMGNLYGTFFSFWVLYILWKLTRKYVIKIGNSRI